MTTSTSLRENQRTATVMAFQMKRKSAKSIYQACFAALSSPASGPRSWLHFALLASMFVVIESAVYAQAPLSEKKKDDLPFSYVLAKRGCTQEDVPALEIYFSQTPYTGVDDPAPPYIRVEISSSPSETIKSFSVEV